MVDCSCRIVQRQWAGDLLQEPSGWLSCYDDLPPLVFVQRGIPAFPAPSLSPSSYTSGSPEVHTWSTLAYCNFCRVHKSLRVTRAMEAGIADNVRDFEQLFA
jgi:hypothetical protein